MFLFTLKISFGSWFKFGYIPGGKTGSHLIPGPIFYGGLKYPGFIGIGGGLAFRIGY